MICVNAGKAKSQRRVERQAIKAITPAQSAIETAIRIRKANPPGNLFSSRNSSRGGVRITLSILATF
jgi:hypothetical protein